MKTDTKIEWEFLVDRAYMPLSYSFNAFVNNRKYLRKYVDISPNGVTGQLFCPNDVYWNKGFRDEVAAKQIEHHKKEGNEYLWRMAKVCEDRGEKLIKDLHARVSARSVRDLSRAELESLFSWALEEIKDFSVFITIPWVMESYLNEQITNLVQSVVGDEEVQNIIAELLSPIKANSSSGEGPGVLKLALEINKDADLKAIFESGEDTEVGLTKDHQKFLSKLDSFVSEYGWVHVRWFKGTPLTRADLVARLRAAISEKPEEKLRQLAEHEKHVKEYVEDFAKKHSLTKDQKDTILLVKEYVYIRTYRTDTLGRAFYSTFPILERAAQLLGLSLDDTIYHSEAELRQKLLGKRVDVDIAARKEAWAILIIDDEYQIYSGKKEVEAFKKSQGVLRGIENVSEIKGQSAFRGVVRGKARIVLDPSDVSKVEKGDVLVAVMTFPSYIAAMERAAAFVTDEGGILCHASIIAREMKKPCVISTKIATKVFKGGDIIEVDADKGVIRVI